MPDSDVIDLQKPPLRLVAATVACIAVVVIAVAGMYAGQVVNLNEVWPVILGILGYAVVRDVQTK